MEGDSQIADKSSQEPAASVRHSEVRHSEPAKMNWFIFVDSSYLQASTRNLNPSALARNGTLSLHKSQFVFVSKLPKHSSAFAFRKWYLNCKNIAEYKTLHPKVLLGQVSFSLQNFSSSCVHFLRRFSMMKNSEKMCLSVSPVSSVFS